MLSKKINKSNIVLIVFFLRGISSVTFNDDFKEEILIKPLLPTHLYTYFQFITLVNSETAFEHSYLSPRSLGEIISRFQVEELHLTLTEGQWRHDNWGYPVLDAAPGAEIYAWFSKKVQDVDQHWKKLTATLSGLFCASLNFIEPFNTVSPQMALWPMGAFNNEQNASLQLKYASLPREIVCTENLTPWKKLLPCESSRGFSALLNSRMIHNTNYHSIGVHFRKICASSDCSNINFEIKLTVSLVYDYKIIGTVDWSIRKLFGQGLPGACPLASSSKIYVDITSNETQSFKLSPEPHDIIYSQRGGCNVNLAVYNIIADGQMINVAAKYDKKDLLTLSIPPPLHFTKYVLGYGKEFGGIVTEITNNYWVPINIVILENAPWWLPIQLSTLRINGKPESDLIISHYYSPGRSRQKPYHLELLLKLPPRSVTTLSVDFEFVFLKWQEYPPDANHGFYIGSTLISALLPTAKNYTSIPITGTTIDAMVNASQQWYPITLRTNGAMVSLPTPDFSMPYNVICLACTVVALAFGPLHNICTKELVLKPLAVTMSFSQKIIKLFKKKVD